MATAILASRYLAGLLAAVLAVLVVAAQMPMRYGFDVGYEEGFGSDLPFVSGFYPFEPEERDAPLNWRWTSERSSVALPGFGQRPLAVSIHVLPVNDEVLARGAKQADIWWQEQQIATLPVRPSGGVYRFLLPPDGVLGAQQGFEIRSTTFTPTNDARSVGIPVNEITIQAGAGPAQPPWGVVGLWLLAALLAWLAVRCCGFGEHHAALLLAPWVLLLAIAAMRDPPRLAFGAVPAVIALAWSVLLVLVLRAVVPRWAQRLAVPLHDGALRWLLLLAFVAFALRYGGKIYPESMWGDIGFHANRFAEVVQGRVLLLSRNRGVDFPYPPALYLLLAPWTLLGVDRRELLRFGGALLDAFSPFLVYTIAVLAFRSTGDAEVPQRRAGAKSFSSTSLLWAVAAAGLYSLSAATFMTTWWNFSTHIFAQFTHLLLITALVLMVPPLLDRVAANSGRLVAGLVLLQSLVFLGHFGFWMNMSLLAGGALALLLVAAWRKLVPWRSFWLLAMAFIAAELIAALLFYSAYTGLFLQQAVATQQGGLTGMAGRAPAPFDALWRTLWNAGFRVHFGFFPVPLALVGLAVMLWHLRKGVQQRYLLVVAVLTFGTFLIAAGFGTLPFVSGSTLSTRWLMFSAWGIACAAIYLVRVTWRWGIPARLAYGLMAAYVLWVTATLWLHALAFRIRPPEPF